MVGPPILARELEMTGGLACKSQDTKHNANKFRYHGILFVIRSRYTSDCNWHGDRRINIASAETSSVVVKFSCTRTESSSLATESNSSATESSYTTINLTSNVVDSTSTVVGLTSTMVGWTYVAIDRASMTLLGRATRRATPMKASTPMGAHLDLPSNVRQADKAYKWQPVCQACSKSLWVFWDRHRKIQHG
jgi:hypothetical protein